MARFAAPGKDKPVCSRCFSLMVTKSGRYGTFRGCSSYPKCPGPFKFKSARSRGYTYQIDDAYGGYDEDHYDGDIATEFDW